MTDFQLKDLASSCLKKIRYSTEQTALEAINRVHKKRKTDLRIYFCKHCLGYHLTHKINKQRLKTVKREVLK